MRAGVGLPLSLVSAALDFSCDTAVAAVHSPLGRMKCSDSTLEALACDLTRVRAGGGLLAQNSLIVFVGSFVSLLHRGRAAAAARLSVITHMARVPLQRQNYASKCVRLQLVSLYMYTAGCLFVRALFTLAAFGF